MKINSPLLWKALFGLLTAASSALMLPSVQAFVGTTLAGSLSHHPFLSGLVTVLSAYIALLTHKN